MYFMGGPFRSCPQYIRLFPIFNRMNRRPLRSRWKNTFRPGGCFQKKIRRAAEYISFFMLFFYFFIPDKFNLPFSFF